MTPTDPIVPPSICICGNPACKIPYRTCHCGCKGSTNLVKQSEGRLGLIKGTPRKYMVGHSTRETRSESRTLFLNGIECRTIPLTQGQESIVWESDYAWLCQYSWYAMWSEDIRGYYAATRLKNKKTILMHRMILGLQYGDEENGDHREPSQTLDNRRSNLRHATDAESIRNRRTQRNNTSGCCGVRYDTRRNKWQARIVISRKEKHLGYFDTKEEAIRARKAAEVKYFGEFARQE